MRDFKLILKKELTDILRDKRSFIMLFVPVLLFPMMYILMGTQMNKDFKKDIPCIVDVEPGTADETLYNAVFGSTGMVDRKEIREDKEEDLRNGYVYAVIRVKDNRITLTYNDASSNSGSAATELLKHIESVRVQALDRNLQAQFHMTLESLQPFQVEAAALSNDNAGNSVMASIAPMMLVVIIMSSGVSVAIDVFTGEKERGTLESLMTTQVSRMSLLMAKFAATLCISLLGMVLSILAYVVSYIFSDAAKAMMGGGEKIGLSFVQTIELLAVCLTLSVFAVSVMTVLGLHAKSVKEAQSQMSLITLIPPLLAGLTLFMESADISLAAMWIPIFNSIVSIKMIFSGTASAMDIYCTAISCLVYSGLMWIISVKMLHSEKLLQG